MATPAPPRRVVAVFGAAWAQPGSALYAESEALGAALARAGFELVNGGYAGTMEGSAKGAATAVPTSVRQGVTVPSLFPYRGRGGNDYLTRVVEAPSLLSRIETMLDAADYFVVMKGTLGTLTELAAVWNVAALAEAAGRAPPLILAYRDPWEAAVASLTACLGIPPAHGSRVVFVEDAAGAVAAIEAAHAERAATTGGAGAMPVGPA